MIHPLLCSIDAAYHHGLAVPIGCIFRDIVKHHDSKTMRINMYYVLEKYRSAMWALRRCRVNLQQETTPLQFEAINQAWGELKHQLSQETTGVPLQLLSFGELFVCISKKNWPMVELGLSTILLQQIRERWNALGEMECDSDSFHFLQSCGEGCNNETASLGHSLRAEVRQLMWNVGIIAEVDDDFKEENGSNMFEN
jgi:hypothetical protein